MTVLTHEPTRPARRALALFADLEQRAVAVLRRVAYHPAPRLARAWCSSGSAPSRWPT